MKFLVFISILITILFSFNSAFTQQFKWKAIPNAPVFTNDRVEDIYFADVNTGYAIHGGDFTKNLIKTTNSGKNWMNISDSSLYYPRCIYFINGNTGWIGTYIGSWPYLPGILKTTDGGYNWVNQFASFGDTTMGICGMSVVDENNIFACGRWYAPAKFYKSTDGGVSWTVKDMSQYATRLIDCHFTSPDSGIVIGGIGDTITTGFGVVLFTSDGGETWVNRYTTLNNKQWGWKISFPEPQTGYISLERFSNGGGSSWFLKTTDGGASWQEKLFFNQPRDEEGVGFVNANTGWIGGWFFNTYKTNDGGDSWFSDPWGYNVNRIRFVNDTLGFAAGQTIYKYERDTTVGIYSLSNEIPEKRELSQNYPNPFNPSTTIEFSVLDYDVTKLTILDALGRHITTLVNERLKPSRYKYNFDASELSAGVYYYRIETLRYTETKRMVLIK